MCNNLFKINLTIATTFVSVAKPIPACEQKEPVVWFTNPNSKKETFAGAVGVLACHA